MSKTLIVFCFIYVVCGLGTFIIPQMGVWGFLIESNYHPPFRDWGRPLMHLGDRWSFYIGAAMLAVPCCCIGGPINVCHFSNILKANCFYFLP